MHASDFNANTMICMQIDDARLLYVCLIRFIIIGPILISAQF